MVLVIVTTLGSWDSKYMSHKRYTIIVMATVALFGSAILYAMFVDGVKRDYAYAPYANALHWFAETFHRPPISIQELESNYSDYSLPAPRHPRPLFRSTEGLSPGRYLILVEPESSGCFSPSRKC